MNIPVDKILNKRCDLCKQFYINTGLHKSSNIDFNTGVITCVHPNTNNDIDTKKFTEALINQLSNKLIEAYADNYYNKWTLGSYDAARQKAKERFKSEFTL